MVDDPQTTSDVSATLWPRAYRAVILDRGGTLFRHEGLVASCDEEALGLAKALAGQRAVDLWDGLRFIEHLRVKATN